MLKSLISLTVVDLMSSIVSLRGASSTLSHDNEMEDKAPNLNLNNSWVKPPKIEQEITVVVGCFCFVDAELCLTLTQHLIDRKQVRIYTHLYDW